MSYSERQKKNYAQVHTIMNHRPTNTLSLSLQFLTRKLQRGAISTGFFPADLTLCYNVLQIHTRCQNILQFYLSIKISTDTSEISAEGIHTLYFCSKCNFLVT